MREGSQRNLFSVIGKFSGRHLENQLTQSLAALFNNSPAFRSTLVAAIFEAAGNNSKELRKALSRSDELALRTQVWDTVTSRGRDRVVLDCEFIRDGRPVAAIEVKVDAEPGPDQLQTYKTHLQSKGARGCLVLLARSQEVRERLDLSTRRVPVLTWPELAAACRNALDRARGPVERRLLEDFMALLQDLELGDLPRLRRQDWRPIRRLVRAWAGWSKRGTALQTIPSLDLLAVLARRLNFHRDKAWAELRDPRWKPQTGVYANDKGEKEEYRCLEASYYKLLPKRNWVSIGLSITFHRNGKMQFGAYWSDSWTNWEWLKGWPKNDKTLRAWFRRPVGQAHEKMSGDLKRALKHFQRMMKKGFPK